MQFNAWSLAKAWNSVAQAQGDDKSRPALYRTTLIEQYPEGIRLVATDSYLLLKAWVPSVDYKGSPEPGKFDLPEEVTVCIDRDRRVISLMNYAMQETKADGQDTPLTMTMVLGTIKPGHQGELEGMTQQAVAFHFDHEYDERIETPIFDGLFPTWKNLWYAHQVQATTRVTFGANGFLRIGKLSAVWDKASIRFEMGGSTGVAKFYVVAPDVNVEGLAMPIREAGTEDEVTPLPPSEEGIHAEVTEFSDALDEFLADVLKTEVEPDDDDVIDAVKRAQLANAARVCIDNGSGNAQLIADLLAVSIERAYELLTDLVEMGVLVPMGDDAERDPLLTQARRLVIESQLGSQSLLQRKLKIGFARAGKLIDELEHEGTLGPTQPGNKAREVLIGADDFVDMEANVKYSIGEGAAEIVAGLDDDDTQGDDTGGEPEPV